MGAFFLSRCLWLIVYSVPRYDRDVGGTGEAEGILNALSFGDPLCEFGVAIVGIHIGEC